LSLKHCHIFFVFGKEDQMSNSHHSHHHSRKPKSGDSSWSLQSNFRNDTTYQSA
jgi:hypothetical protein